MIFATPCHLVPLALSPSSAGPAFLTLYNPNLDKCFAILVSDILFFREGTKDIKTFRPLMREQARLDWSKADNLDNQTRLLG